MKKYRIVSELNDVNDVMYYYAQEKHWFFGWRDIYGYAIRWRLVEDVKRHIQRHLNRKETIIYKVGNK